MILETYRAESTYKAKGEKIMKKNKVILLTALLVASLCGCAKEEKPSTENTIIQETVAESALSEKPATETAKETEKESVQEAKNSNISEDFKEHYNEITIDGKTLKLPISYKEFIDAGFDVQSTYLDTIYKRERTGGSACWKEGENSFFAVEISQNRSDDDIDIAEGDIMSFTWDIMSGEGVDVTFYGGINPESTREEVAAVLNEISSDEDSASYELFLDEDKTMGIYVLFLGDELTTVNLYTDYTE